MRRRTLIAATGAVAVGSALGASGSVFGGPMAASAATLWQPRWAPEPTVDGLLAFEGIEDDRANSHPAGSRTSPWTATTTGSPCTRSTGTP